MSTEVSCREERGPSQLSGALLYYTFRIHKRACFRLRNRHVSANLLSGALDPVFSTRVPSTQHQIVRTV